MKNFLLLTLIAAIAFNFNFLKAEEKLISESFEITELYNELSGNYLEHTLAISADAYLKAMWRITNISQEPVTFDVFLEKISMTNGHLLRHCVLGFCSDPLNSSQIPAVQQSGFSFILEPGASFDPNTETYLAMFSGQNIAVVGKDTFRVTYRNVDNEDDYVTFLCTWDFIISSIEVIEDISHQIFPNPTQEKLNIIWGENNINEIEFFDISGNKLLCKDVTNLSEATVDISAFNSGVYIGYFVKSGNRVKVFRFVKQP